MVELWQFALAVVAFVVTQMGFWLVQGQLAKRNRKNEAEQAYEQMLAITLENQKRDFEIEGLQVALETHVKECNETNKRIEGKLDNGDVRMTGFDKKIDKLLAHSGLA